MKRLQITTNGIDKWYELFHEIDYPSFIEAMNDTTAGICFILEGGGFVYLSKELINNSVLRFYNL